MASFVDTNVIVSAFDVGNQRKRSIALELLGDASLQLVVSAQVLSEFYWVVTRKLEPPLEAEAAHDVVRHLTEGEVVPIDASLVDVAITLARQHRLAPWDAAILAAARRAGRAEIEPRSAPLSTPRDEHVLRAVVRERLALEAAVQRLELQTGHVEQAQPLVLRRPPQRARPAAVEHQVDPVIADRVAHRVRQGLLVAHAVMAHRHPVVEGERVPGETPARPKRRRHPLEHPPPVGPRAQVQERPVARATGTATRPVPTASSTIGPSASRARPT